MRRVAALRRATSEHRSALWILLSLLAAHEERRLEGGKFARITAEKRPWRLFPEQAKSPVSFGVVDEKARNPSTISRKRSRERLHAKIRQKLAHVKRDPGAGRPSAYIGLMIGLTQVILKEAWLKVEAGSRLPLL